MFDFLIVDKNFIVLSRSRDRAEPSHIRKYEKITKALKVYSNETFSLRSNRRKGY